jgi:hypothetical protein
MHEQCYKEFAKDFQNCAICSKPLHMRRNTSKAYGTSFAMSLSFLEGANDRPK